MVATRELDNGGKIFPLQLLEGTKECHLHLQFGDNQPHHPIHIEFSSQIMDVLKAPPIW